MPNSWVRDTVVKSERGRCGKPYYEPLTKQGEHFVEQASGLNSERRSRRNRVRCFKGTRNRW
jgi:hypothetical protein